MTRSWWLTAWLVAGCGRVHFDVQADSGTKFPSDASLPNRVLAWGNEFSGSFLGLPSSGVPVVLPGITDVIDVDAGRASAAVQRDGTALCWAEGDRGNGGGAVSLSVPTTVTGVTDFLTVRVRRETTCGLARGGDAYCWGLDNTGSLGNDTTLANSNVPVRVASNEPFASVDVGNEANAVAYACGRHPSGLVECWGSNADGKLGIGLAQPQQPVPVPIIGPTDAIALAVGDDSACLLASDGLPYCWGKNAGGELGVGDALPRDIPTALTTSARFTQIDMLYQHTCALTAVGELWCWGDNVNGKLGLGDTTPRLVPTHVTSAPAASAVALGSANTYLLTADGHVWVAGAVNNGALGGAGTGDQWKFVQIPNLDHVTRINARTFASAVVIQDVP